MKPQFLPPRLLCRVLRAGWGPVPPQPPSRLVRVKYPPLDVADAIAEADRELRDGETTGLVELLHEAHHGR